MPYYIDFSAIGLKDFQGRLEGADLIPSQLPLLEGIDEKLAALKKAGIASLEDLSRALRGAKGPLSLSAKTGLGEEYLVLLRRTIEGFRPKPVPLGDYPGTDPTVAACLADAGIRDSKALYEAAIVKKERQALAKRAGVAAKAMDELCRLADLSRIQWVGATFARVLYEAGYRSPEAIAAAEPHDIYERVLQANEGNKLYRGKIGLRDMKRLHLLASALDSEMEA
jgi:predicted flap endonuclease-1-like 5' DNA nuclease